MYITLDIGGTKCRIASFSGSSKDSLIKIKLVQIINQWDTDFNNIVGEIFNLTGGKKITALAIGIAGVLSKDKASLSNAVHLSSWQNINLKDSFGIKFSCQVFIENDTFMAGFGEAYYGKIKKDFLYINWGTGVGGCLVNFYQDYLPKNKYFKDSGGVKDNNLFEIRATELGHQVIVKSGVKCSCGQSGCLDAYVGGNGIEVVYKKKAIDLNQKEWCEVVERFALGIMNAVVVYPVEYVVMGGGIALNQFEKIKHLEEIINKKLKVIPPPKIQLASLNDYAGLYGGLAYIKVNDL